MRISVVEYVASWWPVAVKCAMRNSERSHENVNSTCLCCVKLKDELRRVVGELKSMVEIVKILKEDQEQLSRRVDSIEYC